MRTMIQIIKIPEGQYRPSEGVDIETCSDIGGGYDVGWTANNEWMKYTFQ